jgi:hypothetical protein
MRTLGENGLNLIPVALVMEPPKNVTSPSHNPEPVIIDNQKYCPLCWQENKRVPLHGSRQFLCKKHYTEFRRERERKRIESKRKQYREVARWGEYNVKLGTSDFGVHLVRKRNGLPDFKREAEIVKNELDRIWRRKTIGDIAHHLAGGFDSHLIEARAHMLENDNLAYLEDLTGYVQFDPLTNAVVDMWETYRNGQEAEHEASFSVVNVPRDSS